MILTNSSTSTTHTTSGFATTSPTSINLTTATTSTTSRTNSNSTISTIENISTSHCFEFVCFLKFYASQHPHQSQQPMSMLLSCKWLSPCRVNLMKCPAFSALILCTQASAQIVGFLANHHQHHPSSSSLASF